MDLINKINNNILRFAVYSLLLLGILVVLYLTLRRGMIYGLAVSLIPFALLYLFIVIGKPYWGLISIFIVNYFIMGITRYLPGFTGGIAMDAMIVVTILGIMAQSVNGKIEWKRAGNGLILVAAIWLVYCTLELINPEAFSKLAWTKTIRGVAVYFFVITVMSTLLFNKYKDLRKIMFIWSVLTLIAVLKALVQKYWGFDSAELRWLYSGGGRTHLLFSGTRIFSFFTDAGNFGSGMGYSMVVFSILFLYEKERGLRYYYLFVSFAAAYTMMLSGTRGALAVPFAGYVLQIFLSKNFKIALISLAIVIGSFGFLKFTYIGQSVSVIRRMRSSINPNDPSLVVRRENQKLLKAYMVDKPFGTGIGLSGGKAKEYAPNRYLAQIPTDSWFVMIWVETGIVGLILHISILLYIVGYGSYMVLFRIRDPELRGYISANTCGILGIMATSYGNEVFGQFPTAFIVYTAMAFIFKSKIMDKEIAESKKLLESNEAKA